VYIAAIGRSGSTLIERLFGQCPGVCPVGELVYMWQRGMAEDNCCGCGESFSRCPFWRDVLNTAFGRWPQTEITRVTQLMRRVDRTRFIPLLLTPSLRPAFRHALDEYLAYFTRVYDAVATVSGCDVVADSSKNASFAFCLRSCAGLDLRVVHVVRDSRAVAYSWTRTVRRPEASGLSYMPTLAPTTAAWRWNYQNSAAQLLARTGTPTLRIRYEDLVTAPEATLTRIAAFGGVKLGPTRLGFLGADGDSPWAELGVAHSVSGNPMRFKTGRIPIRLDDEWKTAMSGAHRRTVTALTLPLLEHYGYGVGGRQA
jgi:hypothetical protein